jgi:hypothetical protein
MSEQVQATEAPTTEPVVETQATEQSTEQKVEAAKELGQEFDDYKVKVVIDCEPQELTVKELKKLSSLEQASRKRFQEAVDTKDKVMKMWEDMVQDEDKYFKAKGKDKVAYAEEVLRKAIEEAEMSPEQKAAREKEETLSKKEQMIQEFYAKQAQEDIDRGIGEAFKESGLPKSPLLIQKIAATVAQSMDRAKVDGTKPLSYQEAAVKVKTWWNNSIKETMAGLSPEETVQYLGPETVEKLRQHIIAQVSKGPATAKGQAPAATSAPKVKERHNKTFKSWDEFHAFVDDQTR